MLFDLNFKVQHLLLVGFFLVVFPVITVLPFLNKGLLQSALFWSIVLVSSTLTLGLFWVNYQLLMPRFYFQRKFWKYALTLALICLGLFIIGRGFAHSFLPFSQRDPSLSYRFFLSFVLTRLVITIVLSSLLALVRQWSIEKTLRQEAELHLLKAQFNPHFIFNALNSIYVKTLNVSDEASDMIIKLAGLMRYSFDQVDKKYIDLDKEIEVIEQFIAIQKIRTPKDTQVSININVIPSSYKIAPFLLLPLIENSFKHGVRQTSNSHVYIGIQLIGSELSFMSENSKHEFDQLNTDFVGMGHGLHSVQERLSLLYPTTSDLIIQEKNNSFCITLRIDLKC